MEPRKFHYAGGPRRHGVRGRNGGAAKTVRQSRSAGIKPRYRLTTLNQHLDEEWLREAFRQTRKGGACGVDGMRAEEYARDLDARLSDLLARAKTGSYRAPLLKRAYVAKDDGGRRPLGVPCFENKVLERAVLMLLEPVYEQDVLDCSHGFRPERSPHTALQALWKGAMDLGGCWLIDADIRKFHDTLSHAKLREYCRRTATMPTRVQWRGLCAKLRGHYGYYGITGNLRALRRFWLEVKRIWKDRLQRRTGRGHQSWAAFEAKLVRWPLPLPRVVRSVYAQ